MIYEGYMLDPELRPSLYSWLGREMQADVWNYAPTGGRVLIVPAPVSEKWKGILYKPRSATEREEIEAGSGIVIGVGAQVGEPGAPHPYGVRCDDPRDLLGRYVLFRQHGGVNLRTNEEDSEFGGHHALIVLTDRDLLCLGWKLTLGE